MERTYKTTIELFNLIKFALEKYEDLFHYNGLTADFLLKEIIIDTNNELTRYMVMNNLFKTFYFGYSQINFGYSQINLEEKERLIELAKYYNFFKKRIEQDYEALAVLNKEAVNNFYTENWEYIENETDLYLVQIVSEDNRKTGQVIFSKNLNDVFSRAHELVVNKNGRRAVIDDDALIVSLIDKNEVSFNNLFQEGFCDTLEYFYLRENFHIRNYLNSNLKEWRKRFEDREIKDIEKVFKKNKNELAIYSLPNNENQSFKLENSNATSVTENEKLKQVEKKDEIPVYLKSLSESFKKEEPYIICGRDKEIEKSFVILQKMECRNIIFTGAAGVGKTAVVEGIAERIIKENCPEALKGKEIMSLDINLFMSNTKYVGQAQEKFAELTEYLLKHPNVILFIDEIHNIIGAGSGSKSSHDMANALKPILTTDKVSIIGATTSDEYEKWIAPEKALNRRFEEINLKSPERKDLWTMLRGKCKKFETYYGVLIKKDVFDYVVSQASHFYFKFTQPAQTIKLLDTALVIARQDKKRFLDRESVDKVNEELVEKVNRAKKTNPKAIMQVSYHEAGHCLIALIYLIKYINVLAVSIIPDNDSAGINIFDIKDNYFDMKSEEDFIYQIAMDFGGLVAEEIKGYKNNLGKLSDWKKAIETAKSMILTYGMIDTEGSILGKYNCIEPNSKYGELSDKQKEFVSEKITEICDKARKLAKETLLKYDFHLELIARALFEKNALDANDIQEIFAKKPKENEIIVQEV